MKFICLTIILAVLIPCLSVVLILTSPFILWYKLKELNKPKPQKESSGFFDFLKTAKDIIPK